MPCLVITLARRITDGEKNLGGRWKSRIGWDILLLRNGNIGITILPKINPIMKTHIHSRKAIARTHTLCAHMKTFPFFRIKLVQPSNGAYVSDKIGSKQIFSNQIFNLSNRSRNKWPISVAQYPSVISCPTHQASTRPACPRTAGTAPRAAHKSASTSFMACGTARSAREIVKKENCTHHILFA